METKKLIRLLLIILVVGLTMPAHAGNMMLKKKVLLHFYPMGNDLIITLNETEEKTANDFFYIQLPAPIDKNILKDGQYSLYIRKDYIVLEGENYSLGFTVNPEVIQTAFRQKVKYVYTIGIIEGHSDKPLSVKEILNRYLTGMENLQPATFERKGHLKACRSGYQLYCTKDGFWCRCIKKGDDQL